MCGNLILNKLYKKLKYQSVFLPNYFFPFLLKHNVETNFAPDKYFIKMQENVSRIPNLQPSSFLQKKYISQTTPIYKIPFFTQKRK